MTLDPVPSRRGAQDARVFVVDLAFCAIDRLQTLLHADGLQHVDYLTISVEGHELEAWPSDGIGAPCHRTHGHDACLHEELYAP